MNGTNLGNVGVVDGDLAGIGRLRDGRQADLQNLIVDHLNFGVLDFLLLPAGPSNLHPDLSQVREACWHQPHEDSRIRRVCVLLEHIRVAVWTL